MCKSVWSGEEEKEAQPFVKTTMMKEGVRGYLLSHCTLLGCRGMYSFEFTDKNNSAALPSEL